MAEPDVEDVPISDHAAVSDPVRIQILATEHWNLLATRSMTWNEIFTRASMFFTLLSAAVVALALVAQASDFGDEFRLFALILLPVVLFVGIATILRIEDAQYADAMTVVGMNRIRRGYLQTAPELEQYFVTGHYDDQAGILLTYASRGISVTYMLSSTPFLVTIVDAMVAAVLAGLVAESLGASQFVYVVVAAIAGLGFCVVVILHSMRSVSRLMRDYVPKFPGPDDQGFSPIGLRTRDR